MSEMYDPEMKEFMKMFEEVKEENGKREDHEMEPQIHDPEMDEFMKEFEAVRAEQKKPDAVCFSPALDNLVVDLSDDYLQELTDLKYKQLKETKKRLKRCGTQYMWLSRRVCPDHHRRRALLNRAKKYLDE